MRIRRLLAAAMAAVMATGMCGAGAPALAAGPVSAQNKEVQAEMQQPINTVPEAENSLSYEGYTLRWQDEFDGTTLNREDWNVELHDPSWVNNELQAYVDSPENIYLQDGSLVIKPVEIKNADGTVSYTSGRVNTQNKHDFKYGLFEARVKVPEGQGFLPAFWMMPTDENLYGQWPRCGEIDIMEVLGNDTTKSYGTVHYGNPHSEQQGSYVLPSGSFSSEYHNFAVEWEPGRINWYVDGNLIHTANDWYSATEGQGEITYPAPFDQPFYIILNLAVGGNWPGSPDETTNIAQAAMYIDYVRVYQKDSYDEDVERPEKVVVLRDPDANGNYIVNGDFAQAEDLADESGWIFLTTLGGQAQAAIQNNTMRIATTDEGTVDYSVQLVQPGLPLKQGGVYQVSFDGWADAPRTMKVGVSAPDRSYQRYLEDTTVALSPEKQTYTYTFTMEADDDANGRLEFNLGAAGSAAGVTIANVSVKKVGQEDMSRQEKTVLADGNYVYNGKFQEGEKRLGYWSVWELGSSQVTVTNDNNVRRLRIEAGPFTSILNPVVVYQKDLALTAGDYALSFDAEGAAGKNITVQAAGRSFKAEMNGSETAYEYKLSLAKEPACNDIAFIIREPGVYYIDNVRIEEDSLIKNGSFNAGFAGYELYAYTTSDVSYVVDSLNEDNAADITIRNTGDEAWKIQLKQSNVELEEGQWYRLSFQAKSNLDRKLMFAIQRDGSADDNWTPYSGEKIVQLGADYQTYSVTFQMAYPTDLKAVLSISMGAVAGEQISQQHRICIDNILLEKIEAPAL